MDNGPLFNPSPEASLHLAPSGSRSVMFPDDDTYIPTREEVREKHGYGRASPDEPFTRLKQEEEEAIASNGIDGFSPWGFDTKNNLATQERMAETYGNDESFGAYPTHMQGPRLVSEERNELNEERTQYAAAPYFELTGTSVSNLEARYKPSQCFLPGCKGDRLFPTFISYRTHIKNFHEKSVWCPAPSCGHLRPFLNKSDLDRHVRSKHGYRSDRQFKCDIEGCTARVQAFTRKDKLIDHNRKYHREFCCFICSRPTYFATFEEYVEHTNTAHAIPSDTKSINSGISRASSIASITNSTFSFVSNSSMSSVAGPSSAAERLVALLLGDTVLQTLCISALAAVNQERFERNLRRLLKAFAVGLRQEAETVPQFSAAKFVLIRARNSAYMICDKLNNNTKVRKAPLARTQDLEAEYASDESDGDRSDEDIDDLRHLESFIKSSEALKSLRDNLRTFTENHTTRTSSKLDLPGPPVVIRASDESVATYVSSTPKFSGPTKDRAVSADAMSNSHSRREPAPSATAENITAIVKENATITIGSFSPSSLDTVTHLYQQEETNTPSQSRNIGFLSPLVAKKDGGQDRALTQQHLIKKPSAVSKLGYLDAKEINLPFDENGGTSPLIAFLRGKKSQDQLSASGIYDSSSNHYNMQEHFSKWGSTAFNEDAQSDRERSEEQKTETPEVIDDPICCFIKQGTSNVSTSTSRAGIHPRPDVETVEREPSAADIVATDNVELVAQMEKTPSRSIMKSKASISWYCVDLAWKAKRMVMTEKPTPEGWTRIRFTCKCGHKITDDIREVLPGGAHRLQRRLGKNYQTTTSSFSSTSGNSTSTVQSLLHSLSSVLSFGGSKNPSSDLPLHNLANPTVPAASNNLHQQIPAIVPVDLVYLLICYNKGKFEQRLLQLDLTKLEGQSDKALFLILRKSYNELRSRWIRILSFRVLTSIDFVHFDIYKNELVHIKERDALPPITETNYLYKPVPVETVPPVPNNYMMHVFQNPDCADDDPFCLGRFPKRLKEKLLCKVGTKPGWGLQFNEGLDARKLWATAFVFFGLGSLVWGIVWAVLMRSVQDAFAIAGYMVTFGMLTVGTIQAYVLL